jgi:hypothetical protein
LGGMARQDGCVDAGAVVAMADGARFAGTIPGTCKTFGPEGVVDTCELDTVCGQCGACRAWEAR